MPDIPNGYLGYPLSCFPVDPDRNPVPGLPFNPYDVVWRRFAAQILCEQYSDPGRAFARLVAFLPASYTVARVDNSDATVPGTLIAYNNFHLLVFTSGTSTALQLGTQAFQSLAPPRDFGLYQTFNLWNDAAIVVANRINVAGAGSKPHVTFIGHSYGASVSEILAFLAARSDPRRIVFLLTFAAPPAGRIPSQGPVPNNIVSAALLNDGDPVGFFPPPSPFLEWTIPFAGIDTYTHWKLWKPARGLLRLGEDGTTRYDDSLTVDWLVMLAFVIEAVAHLPIDPGTAHYMPEYVRRLWLPAIPPAPCGML